MTTDDNAANLNKSGAAAASQAVSADTAVVQPAAATSAKPSAAKPKPDSRSAPRKGSKLAALVFMLLLLLIIGCAALAFYGWQWQRQQLAVQSDFRQQVRELSELKNLRGQVEQLAARELVDPQQWQQELANLAAIEARVNRQSKSLENMATTSKSDWQLAEAEYLLRLADQRMLMERSGSGALALLQGADQILLQLDELQLFSVREQLARDITALKLTSQVDRSGLYLRLSALAEQVTALPITPQPLPVVKPAPVPDALPSSAPETGLLQKIRHNFVTAMKKLGDQVRVRHHDRPLEPMLPPDAELYLRQNIRFNLEQAQLALLREERGIYVDSLEQAVALLRQFFPMQPQAINIAAELAQLSDATIVVQLPDISGSLQALQAFSARLHKLNGDGGKPMMDEATASGEAL